jgi:Zn-dependent M16 (insulinase) family peptidase
MVWTHVLNNSISTTSLSYNQLASQLANNTSAFNVTTSLGSQNSLNIIFEFSCLKKNRLEAFTLLREMIMNPKFEK